MAILEGEEREKGAESLFKEILAENFPNLKDLEIPVQEIKRTHYYLSAKRPSLRHIILELSKGNDKEFLRQPGEKR